MSEKGRPPNKGAKASSTGSTAQKSKGAQRPAPSAPDPTAVRGIALVALALILGFFLLAKGLDAEDALIDADTGDHVSPSASGDGDDVNGDTDPETGGPSVSVLTPTTRPAAEVSVLVANGSGIARAAGRVSEQLQPKGYVILDPTNAPETATTFVFYAEGYQADAEGVAVALGVAVANVVPMSDPPPAEIAGAGTANVLVQLGPDVVPSG